MKFSTLVKRTFAITGTICAAWIIVSIAFSALMFLGDFVKTVHHDGQDTLTQLSAALFNLPTWQIAIIIFFAAYALIFIAWNKQMISRKFSNFFEDFFQE